MYAMTTLEQSPLPLGIAMISVSLPSGNLSSLVAGGDHIRVHQLSETGLVDWHVQSSISDVDDVPMYHRRVMARWNRRHSGEGN